MEWAGSKAGRALEEATTKAVDKVALEVAATGAEVNARLRREVSVAQRAVAAAWSATAKAAA